MPAVCRCYRPIASIWGADLFSRLLAEDASHAVFSDALPGPLIDCPHEPAQLLDRVQGAGTRYPRRRKSALADGGTLGERGDGPVPGFRSNSRAVGVNEHHIDRLHSPGVDDDVAEDEEVATGKGALHASTSLAELRIRTGMCHQ